MKEAIRYITFDDAVFTYKEDAEYHEILRRLRAKHTALYSNVSHLMREKVSASRRITSIENELKTINDTFALRPEVMDTPDNLRLMVRRINLRLELKRLKDLLKSIKPLLIKQNQMFCRAELDLNRYEAEFNELVKNRNMAEHKQNE